MSCNTQTFTLGIREILSGKDEKQSFCITTKADVASSLQNKYFVIHEPVTQAKHYFWFNVATAGVDPAVPNATGHVIAISANASAGAVATAAQAVINALTWIDTATVTNVKHIEVSLNAFGAAYPARDGFGTNKTGFTFSTSTYGSVQANLGATNGDISVTFEPDLLEVTAPQTGTFLQGEIRRGFRISGSFELKDTSEASIRKALANYGTTFVADNADSDVITGVGTGNLNTSAADNAKQLILREPALAADNNASRDLTIHKARLNVGEVTFSSESELVIPVEFVGYVDLTKNQAANLFSYGDASKIPNA